LIQYNDNLKNIGQFESLNHIIGSFQIRDNPSLSLIEFNNLELIDRDFNIINNDLLCQINGLYSLASIGRNMNISDNANLSECCVLECLNAPQGTVNGTTTIAETYHLL